MNERGNPERPSTAARRAVQLSSQCQAQACASAARGWVKTLGQPYVLIPALNTLATFVYLWGDLHALDAWVILSLLFSGVAAGALYHVIFRIIPPRKSFALPVGVFLALALTAVHILHFGYYRVFKCLVPVSVVDYVRQNPEHALVMLWENLTLWHGMVCVGSLALVTWYVAQAIQRRGGTLHRRHLVAALSGWILFSLVGSYPFLSLDQYAAITCLASLRGVGAINVRFVPARAQLPTIRSSDPVNVVFFRLEAISCDSVQVYNQVMPTTPFWARFIREHPDEVFVARNHFSNSSATDVAVLLMYTGAPVNAPLEVHKTVPLLWDYAKSAGYNTSAFFPFALSWGDFATRFQDRRGHMNLDYVLHALNSNKPLVYDRSINDAELTRAALQYLREREWQGPFLQVISLKMPHSLGLGAKLNGFTFLNNELPEDDPLIHYYNSVYHNDQLMGEFLEAMPLDVLENTVVIAVSDHGGDIYQRRARLENYHQEIAQVPFLIHIPRPVQDRLGSDAVESLRYNFENIASSNLDLVPTIIDIMGLAKHKTIAEILGLLPGQSLLKKAKPPDFILMLNTNELRRWEREGFALTMDNGTKRFIYDMGNAAFYDLETDPRERQNRINDSAYAELLRRVEVEIRSDQCLRRIVSRY